MTKLTNKSIQNDWENKLVKWRASGKTGSAWCRDEGINYHVFLYWKSKLKSISTNTHSKQSTFVEICDPPVQDSGLIIEVQGINNRGQACYSVNSSDRIAGLIISLEFCKKKMQEKSEFAEKLFRRKIVETHK